VDELSDQTSPAAQFPDQAGRLSGLRAGIGKDRSEYRAVVPPIYPSSNYIFESPDAAPLFDYSRKHNPTRDLLGHALAELEGGADGVVTASGMGALNLLFQTLVPAGGRVVAPHDLYGGTWRLLDFLATKGVLRADLVDLTDLDAADAALREPADLVLIETPSNPLLRITDIAAVTELGHAAGARVVVDNTFCSPLRQQPLAFGADFVVHSTTKFVNGHSDVVGGVVVSATAEDHDLLVRWANAMGLTGSPLDAWLTLRGLRTLEPRIRVHDENAAAIVESLLGANDVIRAVHWPGLSDHPGHQLAAKQQSSFGSLLSFEVNGGLPAARRFVDGLEVFNLAESLGGVESLICHPGLMTHAAMPAPAQQAAGISDGLLRISVGIEPISALLADLQAALTRCREL